MKHIKEMVRCLAAVALVAAVAVSAGCRGKSAETSGETAVKPEDVNLMTEAKLLRLYKGEGYYRAEVVNPWDTASMLGAYLLVERGVEPDSVPEGAFTRIDVPLERSLVYSSVHAGIIDEMGAAGAVAGVADGEYFKKSPYRERIAGGGIVNVGSSMSPSMEAVVALSPDAILLSPFENAGHGVIERAGVPVVECADYMEATPKGRAEWVRFFGLLYGRGAEADSIYSVVRDSYDGLSEKVAHSGERPLVLTEMLTDGYWFVPGGASYMARLIQDAGASYPWCNDDSAGSLQLDFSSVYAKAADADYWLIRTYGNDMSLDDLRSVYLLNSQFKAFKNGNVFVANTAEVPLFEEFPFHPEKLLMEYASIFHPEVTGENLRYFKRAKGY